MIGEEKAGQRIDNFLMTYLKGVPKSRIYRICRKGEVRVNKKRIKPDYRLQEGDDVRIPPVTVVDRSQARPHDAVLDRLKKTILFEDDYLIVIDKPAGVPVHGGTDQRYGIIDVFRCIYPDIKGLELVHRLDKDTSGCLILSKKRTVLNALHDDLREGRLKKVYQAMLKGQLKRKVTVDVPLLKNQLQSGERMVKVSQEGKAARTDFNPIEYIDGMTKVDILLHTGRTHQIRVHAAHIGYPVVGDNKYGDKAFNRLARSKGYKRLTLRATRVEFVHPETKKKIKISAAAL